MPSDRVQIRFLLDEHYPGWLAEGLIPDGLDAAQVPRMTGMIASGRAGVGRAGYGTKIRPLGATTPLTTTLPTAPVFRLIVPRVLIG